MGDSNIVQVKGVVSDIQHDVDTTTLNVITHKCVVILWVGYGLIILIMKQTVHHIDLIHILERKIMEEKNYQ